MFNRFISKLPNIRADGDIFTRCLEYAHTRNKFTIAEMRDDIGLDADEVDMLLRDHILKNYFPEVNVNSKKTPIMATRMLSLYGRGIYFNHRNTRESLRLSQIAYYAAVAAFVASMVGAIAELLDLAVVDSVRIDEVSEDLLENN